MDNPLWGAPRIHGELLKLGFEVTQSGLAKYMIKRPRPPSQRWRAFLSNHGVPTSPPWTSLLQRLASAYSMPSSSSGWRTLFGLTHSKSDRKMDCTADHGGIPLGLAPSYLIRDRDQIYGAAVTRRMGAMGIRDKPWLWAKDTYVGDPEKYARYYNESRDSSLSGQGCACPSADWEPRCHHLTAGSRWTSPPIWSNSDFRYTQ